MKIFNYVLALCEMLPIFMLNSNEILAQIFGSNFTIQIDYALYFNRSQK